MIFILLYELRNIKSWETFNNTDSAIDFIRQKIKDDKTITIDQFSLYHANHEYKLREFKPSSLFNLRFEGQL